MNTPKVIVLILSYNGKNLLEEAIESYLINEYLNFDVAVIDNGSTDKTKEWVEGKWENVKVIRTEKNLGYSGGLNFGMEYAFGEKKSDYVLISNNDVKADINVIEELVKIAEKDKKIGFVTGKVYYYDNPDTFQTLGYYFDENNLTGGHIGKGERDKGQFDFDEERFMTDDVFILIKNRLYENIGGYDTNFLFQGEQADWQLRAKQDGFKIYFAHKAKIWHKDSMTLGKKSAFKTYFDTRNNLVLRMKHMDEIFFRRYFKRYLKNNILIPLLKYTLKLKFNYSLSVFRGFMSAIIWGYTNKKFYLKYFY